MKKILLGVLLTLFLLPVPRWANACSCKFISPTETLEMADVVFVGVVLRYETVEDPRIASYKRVELQASKYWKGELEQFRTVITPLQDAACGIDFERGKEYLVYAAWSDLYSDLHTGLCWRTMPAVLADDDLEELGAPDLVPVLPTTWGRIKALLY